MKIEGSVISFLLVLLHEVKKVSTFWDLHCNYPNKIWNIIPFLQALFDCQNDFSYPILTAAIVRSTKSENQWHLIQSLTWPNEHECAGVYSLRINASRRSRHLSNVTILIIKGSKQVDHTGFLCMIVISCVCTYIQLIP